MARVLIVDDHPQRGETLFSTILQQGLWVSRPPHGYKLKSATEGKVGGRTPKKLVLDDEKAPKITRLFHLCASGTY